MNESDGKILEEKLRSLQTQMEERDRRYTERFDSQERAVAAALTAAEKAVLKAETAADKRFDSVNEFRQALTDQTATFASKVQVDRLALEAGKFITRDEMNAIVGGITAALSRLDTAHSTYAGQKSGASALWALLAGGIGLVLAAGALIITVTGN